MKKQDKFKSILCNNCENNAKTERLIPTSIFNSSDILDNQEPIFTTPNPEIQLYLLFSFECETISSTVFNSLYVSTNGLPNESVLKITRPPFLSPFE